MHIVAIVGMAGSGKSIIAERLRNRGIPVIRFGQFIVDEVARRELPLTPHNERQIREELRAQYGMDVCAQLAIPQLHKNLSHQPLVAIDGLYSYSEYRTLRREFGDLLIVVAIFTPRHLRHQRLTTRSERPLTIEEAAERDIAEIEKIEKGPPIALADYTLVNDQTVNVLLEQFDELLQHLLAADSG